MAKKMRMTRRQLLRALEKTKPIERKGGEKSSVGLDYFTNLAARMGYGTPSLAEDTSYEMVRLSNNYWLMLTLYRNHWLIRRVVDVPAQDMTRAWAKLSCQLEPDEIKKFDRTVERTFTPARVEQAIKWARLYGGAGALICIKGHEGYLDKPLDLDDVNPGSYLGLIPFDRWVGIQPNLEVSTDMDRPLDWGLPKSYQVTSESTSRSYEVHSSRIIRFTGPQVPTPELQAQMYWGISIVEVIYEELKKRDNASWSMLQLLFRAQILAQRNPELAGILSGLGMSQQATKNFYDRMQAQNQLLSNQSMLVLGEEGELFNLTFSFSGLADLYDRFEVAFSGAAEIPYSRLFGRTQNALAQTGEGDERIYEERIAHDQATDIKPQLSKLYPVICMSEFGEVPDDLDYKFPSVRILTEEEKGDIADKGSAPVIAAYNAGLISQKVALMEFRELSDRTGIFTNITDEIIDAAEEEVVLPGEANAGETGEVGQGESGRPDPKSFQRPNPRRELKEESEGAMDDQSFLSSVGERIKAIFDRTRSYLRDRDPFANHAGDQ